jgi:hypothetical protein
MSKYLIFLVVLLGFAHGQRDCLEFQDIIDNLAVTRAHPYPGRVTVNPQGNTYRIGIPWQRVPGYGVQRLEIIPTRGRDVGQPIIYTDRMYCFDPQVKFAGFDGKFFWISIPRWMLNGGCYEALIYRIGPGRESLERRQYSFCFNPGVGQNQRPATPQKWVIDVQTKLKKLGHDPGPIDGIYGPKTRAAVIQFQRFADLKVDGIAGPRTREALDFWLNFKGDFAAYPLRPGEGICSFYRRTGLGPPYCRP